VSAFVHDYGYDSVNESENENESDRDEGGHLTASVNASCCLTALGAMLETDMVDQESGSANGHDHDGYGYVSLLTLAERM
jgi:hypothetical protein